MISRVQGGVSPRLLSVQVEIHRSSKSNLCRIFNERGMPIPDDPELEKAHKAKVDLKLQQIRDGTKRKTEEADEKVEKRKRKKEKPADSASPPPPSKKPKHVEIQDEDSSDDNASAMGPDDCQQQLRLALATTRSHLTTLRLDYASLKTKYDAQEDEIAQLRADNAALHAEIERLQRAAASQPTSSTAPPPMLPESESDSDEYAFTL
jgi:hypothetical protein